MSSSFSFPQLTLVYISSFSILLIKSTADALNGVNFVQALKTGQLPADLNIGDNDVAAKSENAKEDKMVTDGEEGTNDEPGNAESEKKNDGSEEMEQV